MQRRMLDVCCDEPVPDASMRAPGFQAVSLWVFTASSVEITANEVIDRASFLYGTGLLPR